MPSDNNLLHVNPDLPTEVFLILHEKAHFPSNLGYEYMTGRLRQELEAGVYGRILTKEGERRAANLGRALRHHPVSAFITEKFSVTSNTAEVIRDSAGQLDTCQILTDPHIGESDLSYLTPERYEELGQLELDGDPNACLRDWMTNNPEQFTELLENHVALWNDWVPKYSGSALAFVLHVEGILILTALLLGLPPADVERLHFPRGCPVHVRLSQEKKPIMSLHDQSFWSDAPATPYGYYTPKTSD